MKRSLRALSVVFGSAALLLGPGQAVAGGDWWGDDGGGWWSGGKGWDSGKGRRTDARDVFVCLDEKDLELRVKFKVGTGNYRYSKDIDVASVIKGEAVCADDSGWGYKEEVVYFKDVVTCEEEAVRKRNNKFRAELDLEESEDMICGSRKELVALDIHKAIALIDGREFFIDDVDLCDDHWYDGGWEDGRSSSWW